MVRDEPCLAAEEFEIAAQRHHDRQDGQRLADAHRAVHEPQQADLEEKERRDDVAQVDDRRHPVEREAEQKIHAENGEETGQHFHEGIDRTVAVRPIGEEGDGEDEPCDAEDHEVVSAHDVEVVFADDPLHRECDEGVLEQQRENDRDDGDLRHAPCTKAGENGGGGHAGDRMDEVREDGRGGDDRRHHDRQHGIREVLGRLFGARARYGREANAVRREIGHFEGVLAITSFVPEISSQRGQTAVSLIRRKACYSFNLSDWLTPRSVFLFTFRS